VKYVSRPARPASAKGTGNACRGKSCSLRGTAGHNLLGCKLPGAEKYRLLLRAGAGKKGLHTTRVTKMRPGRKPLPVAKPKLRGKQMLAAKKTTIRKEYSGSGPAVLPSKACCLPCAVQSPVQATKLLQEAGHLKIPKFCPDCKCTMSPPDNHAIRGGDSAVYVRPTLATYVPFLVLPVTPTHILGAWPRIARSTTMS
jgi:hypothetical protein